MLSFRRPLDGQDFASGAALRNFALVAATLGFPFALRAYLQVSGCRGIGGACGALALIVSMLAKPLIFALFVLSFATIFARRLRDAGLPRALAAAIGIIMLADIQWATVAGAPWSVGFVLGFMGGIPVSFMAGLALIVALCVAHTVPEVEPETHAPRRRSLGAAVWIFLGLILAASMVALIEFMAMWKGAGWLLVSMRRGALSLIAFPPKAALAAAPAAMCVFCYREWVRGVRYGAGSPLIYLIGVCFAVILAGALTMTANLTWLYLASWLGIRSVAVSPQALHLIGLAELICLLLLPWLLWLLPREPSEATGRQQPFDDLSSSRDARSGSTASLRPGGSGAIAFGRRGAG